jgi:phenylalanyl-tRNA synthetase beta chain
LLAADEPLLVSFRPFDIFIDAKGEKLPLDQKSIGVSLVFRSPERTLTNEEVAAAQERLKELLIIKLNVKFRDSHILQTAR